MSVITCTAIEKYVPQLFQINETMCCNLCWIKGIDKKTLKELSWHLHPGTCIYGLCLIFNFMFHVKIQMHAHCLIQII